MTQLLQKDFKKDTSLIPVVDGKPYPVEFISFFGMIKKKTRRSVDDVRCEDLSGEQGPDFFP